MAEDRRAPSPELTALRQEVAELKSGTDGLAQQVSTLAVALQTVGQLQKAQRELDTKVKKVTETAVSKEDVEKDRIHAQRETHERRKRELTRIYSLLGLFAVFLAAGALAVTNSLEGGNVTTFAPLDNSQTQQVLSAVPGVVGPAVLAGQDVAIKGTKCNVTAKPVPLTGIITWTTLEPAGTVIEASRGAGIRQPGCTTKTFQNPMPIGVTQRMTELAARGIYVATWVVSGVETPQSSATHNVSSTWQTQPFKIVVKH